MISKEVINSVIEAFFKENKPDRAWELVNYLHETYGVKPTTAYKRVSEYLSINWHTPKA